MIRTNIHLISFIKENMCIFEHKFSIGKQFSISLRQTVSKAGQP